METPSDIKSRLNANGIFSQLIWLLVAAVITVLVAVFILKWDVLNEWRSVDIHFHDTYFIIDIFQIIPPLFLGMVLLIFLAKENRKKFSRRLPNIFILVTGILLIVLLSILHRLIPASGGWTFYPPLSVLEDEDGAEAADIISYLITGLQVLIILAMLYVAYHWGRAKRNN